MSTPDSPSRSGREQWAIQPAEPAVDRGLLAELDKLGNLSPAQKLERLAENDIVLHLQLQGFDPTCDDWKDLAGALIEYGYSVFMGWTITGSVRSMAARANGGHGVHGLDRLPEAFKLPADRAHDFVMDLLEVAVERFRGLTLAKHKWSPTGGASLRTFFVGRCLMVMPDVYEQWKRREGSTYGLRHDDRTDDNSHEGRDPASVVADHDTIEHVFNGGPNTNAEVRVMFELQQLGWSLAEIAAALADVGYPNTEGSVRTKMTRARRDARRRLVDDGRP